MSTMTRDDRHDWETNDPANRPPEDDGLRDFEMRGRFTLYDVDSPDRWLATSTEDTVDVEAWA